MTGISRALTDPELRVERHGRVVPVRIDALARGMEAHWELYVGTQRLGELYMTADRKWTTECLDTPWAIFGPDVVEGFATLQDAVKYIMRAAGVLPMPHRQAPEKGQEGEEHEDE